MKKKRGRPRKIVVAETAVDECVITPMGGITYEVLYKQPRRVIVRCDNEECSRRDMNYTVMENYVIASEYMCVYCGSVMKMEMK